MMARQILTRPHGIKAYLCVPAIGAGRHGRQQRNRRDAETGRDWRVGSQLADFTGAQATRSS